RRSRRERCVTERYVDRGRGELGRRPLKTFAEQCAVAPVGVVVLVAWDERVSEERDHVVGGHAQVALVEGGLGCAPHLCGGLPARLRVAFKSLPDDARDGLWNTADEHRRRTRIHQLEE